jgi:preprotein translocase subunit SecY
MMSEASTPTCFSGVMPLIFASSLLALPSALARYTDVAALDDAARAIGPGGPAYVPVNIALIAFFNYYYTFLQVCVAAASSLPSIATCMRASMM